MPKTKWEHIPSLSIKARQRSLMGLLDIALEQHGSLRLVVEKILITLSIQRIEPFL